MLNDSTAILDSLATNGLTTEWERQCVCMQ